MSASVVKKESKEYHLLACCSMEQWGILTRSNLSATSPARAERGAVGGGGAVHGIPGEAGDRYQSDDGAGDGQKEVWYFPSLYLSDVLSSELLLVGTWD